MEVKEVVDRIVRSADRLAEAIELSRRDEKWWSFMNKECWRMIQLSWALRGVILKGWKGTEIEEPGLNDQVKKQLEEILERAERD